MMKREEVEKVRQDYPPGTKVILHEMRGEPQMPPGLRGEVRHVDDAGQIHVHWENGSTLALTREDDFTKVDTLRVIVCRPTERAEVIEISDDLRSMQEVVGGMIEEYQPFYDAEDERVKDVAIVCNDEGKFNGSRMNRTVYDDQDSPLDIIYGTFFICYAPIASEKFLSLPKDLEEKFLAKFELPEMFLMTPDGLRAEKFIPVYGKEPQEHLR